ncbi:hypothetical protein PNEG_01789 [Pneumocystis murina B123]|uniref:Uncharacterized protein n=1 Tax=Pneumocystis murina (strain B123) TaxID=1069680 RepID=M7P833_PNEMU|nr:hypothetical protein PNEG_01789 [Pneumocystis murina B123]EMR10035.1 hypothetical protein PNEG_01789 [Pneumocystis murina B123]
MPKIRKDVTVLSLILSLYLLVAYFFYLSNTNYTKYPNLLSKTHVDIRKQKKISYYSNELRYKESSRELRMTMFSTKTFENKPQTLYEHLAFQFPYKEQRFPDYIWQFWKYEPSDSNFDSRFLPLEASWKKYHNSSIYTIVKEEYAHYLIRHLYLSIPDVIKAYNALSTSILKANFFRYLILFARGGIYSDINTELLLPASNWISESIELSSIGLIIGIETDITSRPDTMQDNSEFFRFSSKTIRAKPGHPVLREIIVNITEEILQKKSTSKNSLKSTQFINSALWTNIIIDYLSSDAISSSKVESENISYSYLSKINKEMTIGDIVILPITSFSLNERYISSKTSESPQAILRHSFKDIKELN